MSDVDLGGPFADFEAMGRRLSDYEIARALTWERTHHFELLSEYQQSKMKDWPVVSYDEYRESERVMAACRACLEEASRELDVLVTPSATGEAPEGLDSTGDTAFNILATWTHVPCVTLPLFKGPSDLPVGLQLVGHRCRGSPAVRDQATRCTPRCRSSLYPYLVASARGPRQAARCSPCCPGSRLLK